jgi:hypothetical protein
MPSLTTISLKVLILPKNRIIRLNLHSWRKQTLIHKMLKNKQLYLRYQKKKRNERKENQELRKKCSRQFAANEQA